MVQLPQDRCLLCGGVEINEEDYTTWLSLENSWKMCRVCKGDKVGRPDAVYFNPTHQKIWRIYLNSEFPKSMSFNEFEEKMYGS